MPNPDEFYIGYVDKVPPNIRKRIRLAIVVLAIVIPVLATLLVVSQKGFAVATFELSNLTRMTGIVSHKPVPNIKVIHGKDGLGNDVYQTIPLINFGKFGAKESLTAFEEKIGKPLEQVVCTLEGKLIYRDGKTLLELTKKEDALIEYAEKADGIIPGEISPSTESLGKVELAGEITDSKCYFGTMKPGEGKPHRSCAALCIKGGIPPVLVTQNEAGNRGYYLLLGPKGEPINQEVLTVVAEPVTITGELVKYDDWFILYTNPYTDIQRIQNL